MQTKIAVHLMALTVASLAACGGTTEKIEPLESTLTEATREPSRNVYGERGAENSWPPIYEQNTRIAENLIAKNYYVIVDGSGSMTDDDCADGGRKIDVAVQALSQFFKKLPSDANVGIYIFDKKASEERLVLGNHSPQKAIETLTDITPGRLTPLTKAITDGMIALSEQAKTQLGYGEFHLVIVTDGDANSTYELDDAVSNLLYTTPIVLHTIGFCIKNNHTLNQPGYTVYRAANNPNALMEGLDAILAESTDFTTDTFAN